MWTILVSLFCMMIGGAALIWTYYVSGEKWEAMVKSTNVIYTATAVIVFIIGLAVFISELVSPGSSSGNNVIMTTLFDPTTTQATQDPLLGSLAPQPTLPTTTGSPPNLTEPPAPTSPSSPPQDS